MILIDTGYLIAVADRGDALHPRCLAWSRAVGGLMLVTEYVLVEAVNHFSQAGVRRNAQTVVDWIQSDASVEIIGAQSSLFDRGLRLHRARADKDWSLTDCISFHVMQERGVRQALAYDIHFEQAGFDALLRRDPPA